MSSYIVPPNIKSISALLASPEFQLYQETQKFYDTAFEESGMLELRRWVQRTDQTHYYPSSLPPRTETLLLKKQGCQYLLEWLQELVAEANQLADMMAGLAADMKLPQYKDDDAKTVEYARCGVRLKEISIDYNASTVVYDQVSEKQKVTLQRFADSDPRYLAEFKKEDIHHLKMETEIWDRGFPALKSVWEVLQQKLRSQEELVAV